MWDKIKIGIVLCCLTCALGMQAENLSEDARVWLVTYAPGEDTYTSYGHTAIRISDEANGIDVLFNYGMFDFNTDHFYWKFVRGETWYELGIEYPNNLFERGMTPTGRAVYWQELNLLPAEKQALLDALLENLRPENKKYLYNFVYDNCATRPYHILCAACQTTLVSDYQGHVGCTYRDFLRPYVGSMAWINAGINLLFGPLADKKMDSEQRLFLPEELMYYIEQAHRADTGEALVLNSHIAPFERPSIAWYASWPIGLAVYFLLIFGISWWDRRRGKWSWWVEVVTAIPFVLLLLLVGFLTFFSCHPLVGFGWRLLIIPVTHLCARLVYIIR